MQGFHLFLSLMCYTAVTIASNTLTDWDFNMKRFEYNTSNPEIADFHLRIVRTKSNEYAFNGSFILGVDIDDTVSVWVKLYRSETGSSQYRQTAYSIAPTTFYKFMTNIYVKMMQNDLSKCTNIPVYKKEFNAPLKKGIYYANMCVLGNKNMPTHLQPGHYRITAELSSQVLNANLFMSGYVEIFAKAFA
ncbi:uncharacterized protein LOC129953413 [Eupeodes corollae]|uniref:uncharacterized protein LOC129953413 n=1 Tax=Eupeodes corollae TaxID=290404 RepID=UPI0024926514|nr:uncharacterized protein LOC129953413 [Eupeodes corollae]